MSQIKNPLSWYLKLSKKEKVSWTIVFALLFLYVLIESRRGGDFVCYLDAAQKLLQGQNIYEPPFQTSRYLYHPLFATLLIPALWLPKYLMVFLWNSFNLLLFVRVIFLLQTYFELRLQSRNRNRLMWLMIVLCIPRFLQYNFMYGQMTVFLLWAMIEGVFLAARKRDVSSGALVGFAMVVKMIPIVLLPYFLFRRKTKAFSVALLSGFVSFFLPMLITGYQKFWEIIHYWIYTLQPNSAELGADNQSHYPQNLSTLLFRVLTETNAEYSKNIFHLS